MLTVHINEVQCAFSIHAYSVCWSNLNPVFSIPAHLPQSLFYCQASFGSLRGHVRSHPPGSDLAHFFPCLDPSILLYAIWFCASWCLNSTASCPQSHFSIHSPSAGHPCWRGVSATVNVTVIQRCASLCSLGIFAFSTAVFLLFNGRMSKRKFR